MRTCPKCEISKEFSEFWKTCSYCKQCQKEHWRNRISKNKEGYASRRKELWFAKHARPCPNCQNLFVAKARTYCTTQCSFLHQIKKMDSGCWEWQGLRNSYGYGYFTNHETQKRSMVHRYSYTIYKGEIPENLHVLHRCDNPKCCAPEHLFVGTDKDNMQDCKNKGRTAKGDKVARKGEKNGNAIFTNEIVKEIRRMCSEGFKDRHISEKLGADKYSVFQINSIRHRKTWKHIE